MTNIKDDFSRAIQADGFTRLQMKHILMLATANMSDAEIQALLKALGMTADDLEL
jgi:hypothetical protein